MSRHAKYPLGDIAAEGAKVLGRVALERRVALTVNLSEAEAVELVALARRLQKIVGEIVTEAARGIVPKEGSG